MISLQQFYDEWYNENDLLLVHTSGSTGVPKPLWVEKKRMIASAKTTCDFLNLKKGDNALLCLPLQFIAGKMMVVRTIERKMNLMNVNPSNHPLRDVLDDCQKKGIKPTELDISFAAMIPSQVYNSLKEPKERILLSHIKHLIIGGGNIPKQLEEELKSMPNAIWSTYGMTETLSHIALRRINGSNASEWYTPVNNVRIYITDNDNCQITRGRLVIDAPEVCNTLLKTNDIAELHSDGKRFRIIGRKDNVICSGGIKIQAEEIEEILRQHISLPLAITHLPDNQYGEAVTLLIQHDADNDRQRKEIEEMLHAAFSILDRYSVPKHVIYVEAIPLTATGKINRAQCQELAKEKNY